MEIIFDIHVRVLINYREPERWLKGLEHVLYTKKLVQPPVPQEPLSVTESDPLNPTRYSPTTPLFLQKEKETPKILLKISQHHKTTHKI